MGRPQLTRAARSNPGLIHPGPGGGLANRQVKAGRPGRTVSALLYGDPRVARTDMPWPGQGHGGDAAQSKSENENPAHHPEARNSGRGATVSTGRRPAARHDAVP
jgi:hypothetical protein